MNEQVKNPAASQPTVTKEQARNAWISLNAHYCVDNSATAEALMHDAGLWLDYAHGIAHALGDAVLADGDIREGDLASALLGVATLIEMGRGCTEQAHRRLLPDAAKKH